MCRNIKTLYNFEPPANDAEVQAAALQYVRKVSGYNKPSQLNEEAFAQAVAQITVATHQLLESLSTKAPAKNREQELAKARRNFARRSLS